MWELFRRSLVSSMTSHPSSITIGDGNGLSGGDAFFVKISDNSNGYWGGYRNGWSEADRTVKVVGFNLTQGYVQNFAFNQTKIKNSWDQSEKIAWRVSPANESNQGGSRGIKNMCPYPNVFSVMNLRAGEIVKVKTHDPTTRYNNGQGPEIPLKHRFIINHSDNSVDNLPWSDNGNSPWGGTEWEQQFVMLEDGNLDLKVAPWVKIETVEIVSNYTQFEQKRAKVSDESISLQLDCRKYLTGNFTWRFNQIEPVVLYRGDLTPGTVSVSKTHEGEDDSNTGTFTITISGFSGKQYDNGYWEGGSIIVMLDQKMVTYTIPYEVANQRGNAQPNSASWNFWNKELQVGRSSAPAYKSLLAHDIAENAFQHSNTVTGSNGNGSQPLSLYKGKMNGQNAYYHAETAGLIFEGNAGVYGLLNETTDPVSNGDRWIALRKGGKMIIPGLKKGDQVWMFVDHYGPARTPQNKYKESALSFYVKNAKDALGNSINQNQPVVTGGSSWGPAVNGKWAKQYYSAMHFFAANDGDMEFTVDGQYDTNYAKICYIKILKADAASGANGNNVVGNIEPTNAILGYTYDDHGYEFLTTQDPAGKVTRTAGTLTLHESGRGSLIQKWKVLEASGTLDKNILDGAINNENPPHYDQPSQAFYGPYFLNGWGTNPIKFKYTSHDTPNFGSFLLRGMDYDHDGVYCLDYADRVIAEGFLQTMNYPYTWDLTDILNTKTGNSQSEFEAAMNRTDCDTTKVWINMEGAISLQNNMYVGVNNRTLASGTQLFSNNKFIEESAGLGWATINMDNAYNGSLQVTNEGVKIKTYNGWEHRLYIPGINKNGRLFVRGKKINNGIGFVVKALLEPELGPNTMKRHADGDTRVDLTRIETSDATQTLELFNYDGNFSNYIDSIASIVQTKDYDEFLKVYATSQKIVEEKKTNARIVDNSPGLYKTANAVYRTEERIDDDGNVVLWPIEDNHIYQNNDNSSTDNWIYDSDNVSSNDVLTGKSYFGLLDLGGSGSTDSRIIQLTGLPESNCQLTIVARANQPRQLNIYSGAWEGSLLATMIARDALMAKTVKTGGASTITIGSKDGSIEVYAILVKEEDNGNNDANDTETYIGYVDVTAAQGGVTLYLNDIIIEKIAYSTDEKSVNIKGYASESRDHYIDHDLTEYFCNVPVKAYTATIEGTDYTKAIMTPLKTMEITSAANNNTGCILYSSATGDDKSASFNLFVPDIHDYLKDAEISQSFIGNTCTNSVGNIGNADQGKIAVMGNNIMIGVVDGVQKLDAETTVGGTTYVNYVLQYQYIDYYGNLQSGEEKLYRVNRDGIKLGKNKAYARFDKSIVGETHYGYVNGIKLWFGDEEENADGIYNLNGVRINKPQKSGIYVKNGKKVYIK